MACSALTNPRPLALRRSLAAAPLAARATSHVAALPRHRLQCSASSSPSAAASPSPEGGGSDASPPAAPEQQQGGGVLGWVRAQQARSAELRKKLGSLGLAAVLAYGMFDGLTYTVAFAIAFLGYEAQTGLNPTQNVADIVKICILMWASNNVTRPFRLAGAAALAPFMDKVMDRMQAALRLPSKFAAFAIVVAAVAGACFLVLGGLFCSRLVAG